MVVTGNIVVVSFVTVELNTVVVPFVAQTVVQTVTVLHVVLPSGHVTARTGTLTIDIKAGTITARSNTITRT